MYKKGFNFLSVDPPRTKSKADTSICPSKSSIIKSTEPNHHYSITYICMKLIVHHKTQKGISRNLETLCYKVQCT